MATPHASLNYYGGSAGGVMMTHEELDKIPEILITDEMVEKGFDYLCDHDWGDLGEFNASRQHVVNLLTLCLSGHPLSFDPNLKERPE